MRPEVIVDIRLGVLQVLALDGPHTRDRAREDGLEERPELGRVEVVGRDQIGEVRLAEREGVEREVTARQEHERADPAVLGHDTVVIGQHERRHRPPQPKLRWRVLEHLLDQVSVVEARAESAEPVDREMEHSPPPGALAPGPS